MEYPENLFFYKIKSLPEYKVGDNLGIRIIRNDQNLFQIALMIFPKTTQANIKDSWSKIKNARQSLASVQSPAMFDEAEKLKEFFFLHKNESDFSHNKISEAVNYTSLSVLKELWSAIENDEFTEMAEIWTKFVDLLKVYGIDKTDIDSYLFQGFMDLSNGVVPWTDSTGPVSRENVRSQYRKWIRTKKSYPEIPSRDELIKQLEKHGSRFKEYIENLKQSPK